MAWPLLLVGLLLGCGGTAAATTPPSSCSGTSLLQIRNQPALHHAAPESHVAQRRRLGRRLLDNRGPLDDEIEAYARRYHARFSQTSMVLYQHVSKSAGTMLCEVGRANGCRTTWDNCHVNSLDAPVWLVGDPPAPGNVCRSLAARYGAGNVSLEGNEKFLPNGVLCRGFWNVVVMRDPIKRLISHLHMFSRWTESVPRVHFDASPVWAHASLADVIALRPRIANNFFIRSMLGAGVYMLPFASVNASHLEEAAGVLGRFDVLLIVDERSKASLEESVRLALGLDVRPHHPRRDRDSGAYARSLNWTGDDWEALGAANALDSELWERAQALSRVDSLVFRHPRFAQVSATRARAPCGYLAK